jgi:hypothetical protein
MPSVKQIDNFIFNWKRTKGCYSTETMPLEEFVNSYSREAGNETPYHAAIIGCDRQQGNDRIRIGNGTDASKFYLAFSSPALREVCRIAVLSRGSFPVVLHMDSTFKTNIHEFPLMVAGLGDAHGHFHLLGGALVSHRDTASYTRFLHDLVNYCNQVRKVKCDYKTLIA